jgi:hypothetical protein
MYAYTEYIVVLQQREIYPIAIVDANGKKNTTMECQIAERNQHPASAKKV